MEPVSILSAAAAISAVAGKAWELGSFVRELCQGAKTVDGRVRRLESAVTELARACEHVQGQFESMASSSSSETSALAWDEQGALTASIKSQVKDCRRTLKELRRLLVDLRPSGSSFFGRTSRHVKLQDRGQQISDFSMRIKTHTDTLQMSLQIVIIKIALATPDFLLRQLGTALEDLRVRLSRIENNSNPSDSRTGVRDGHVLKFLEHAREALRSGTTLYEASTAGSIAEVMPATDNERAARIKEWANSVDALRGTHNDNSGVTRPDTVSAHSHKSLVNTTEQTVDHCIVADQDTLAPADALMGETHNSSHSPFIYPFDDSLPLDRLDRRVLIKSLDIRIRGKLEALICTGKQIESTKLSELFAADQTAFTAPSSITASNPQQGTNGLALLLAVYFRDVYLIKPLIQLGYSPNTRVRLDRMRCEEPITSAIAVRCGSVIRELLNNGAKLPYSCRTSPLFALLNHDSLRLFPPASVESIKQVINVLMPHSPSDTVACACSPKSGNDDGMCDWYGWTLLCQARDMPAELSNYRLRLVAYLLEYIVSADKSIRHTTDSPLCNALFLKRHDIACFIVETAEQSTLKVWLRKKNPEGLSPLFQAMLDPNVPLKVVRTLLDKGADLGSFRWTQLGSFSLVKTQTAREFALESGRRDLIALVKEYDRK